MLRSGPTHTLFRLGLIKIDADGRPSAPVHIWQAYALPEAIFLPRAPSLRPDPTALREKFRLRS